MAHGVRIGSRSPACGLCFLCSIAARIAAKADGGEILIPEPVRHLLSGKSFTFSDRGEFAMKGFDDAVRLYEVQWRE